MCDTTNITPLSNITSDIKILKELQVHKKNIYTTNKDNTPTTPDCYAYFFATRKLPFLSCLRGKILIDDLTAYDTNITHLSAYITNAIKNELDSIDYIITRLNAYQYRYFDVGISYPTGPDPFIVFFNKRNLPLETCFSSSLFFIYYYHYNNNRDCLIQYQNKIESLYLEL